MKVFITWSGDMSKALAQLLKTWLPCVIQAVEPYFSPEDVSKGARWNTEIAKELQDSKVGIICLTRDNLEAPWIMFEAGALSKSLDSSRVSPILFGIEPADVKGPLVQFQATSFNKVDIRKLLGTINAQLAENSLDQGTLDSVFEKWWPDLEASVNKCLSSTGSTPKAARPEKEILEEILDLARANVKTIAINSDTMRLLQVLLQEMMSNMNSLTEITHQNRQQGKEVRAVLDELMANRLNLNQAVDRLLQEKRVADSLRGSL